MPLSKDVPVVKTRILVLSDTHADEFPEDLDPSAISADVVIHCGDLTEHSTLKEYEATIRLLRSLKAPLKLVIAGNHDFSLDPRAFQRILDRSRLGVHDEAVKREYGDARALLLDESNKSQGIVFLDEGTHHFQLVNGAKMVVFASPYTPSKHCEWGFQYTPSDLPETDDHDWQIEDGTNIVVTHGPPHGILDRTCDRQRAGSHSLFAAVERARPQLHCFGHIHEGWGARAVTWRGESPGETSTREKGPPSHLTHIDNDKSATIESLAGLKPGKFDSEEDVEEKRQKLEAYRAQRACYCTSQRGDVDQTLFINAAIQGESEGVPDFQLPWIVDLELPMGEKVSSR